MTTTRQGDPDRRVEDFGMMARTDVTIYVCSMHYPYDGNSIPAAAFSTWEKAWDFTEQHPVHDSVNDEWEIEELVIDKPEDRS